MEFRHGLLPTENYFPDSPVLQKPETPLEISREKGTTSADCHRRGVGGINYATRAEVLTNLEPLLCICPSDLC